MKENIPEGCIAARITAVHKDRYEIACEKGNGWAVLKSSIFRHGEEEILYPTTGDFAAIRYNKNGESVIHQVLERKTYFSRNDPSGSGHREQLVAANFDYVFIVTTHRQLIQLESGVMFIDTPGMRELGMWDVSDGLRTAFGDVEQYFGKCRFSDCRHESEPGCALKAALENGQLSYERWESYQKLKKEARYSEDKSRYFKETQKLAKKWAKQSRNKQKYLK